MLSKLIRHFDGKNHEKKEFQNSNVGGKQIEDMHHGGFEVGKFDFSAPNKPDFCQQKSCCDNPQRKAFMII